jgi:DNA-binding protein H-NS
MELELIEPERRPMTTVQTATQAPAPKDKAARPSPANGHAASESNLPLPLDLTTLSYGVLSALLPAVQHELKERDVKAEAALVASTLEAAITLGISPARLAAALVGRKPAARVRATGGPDGRHVVKPKYWCITDHSLRWSGRGVAPKWYADHIAGGGKPEDMLIPEGAT